MWLCLSAPCQAGLGLRALHHPCELVSGIRLEQCGLQPKMPSAVKADGESEVVKDFKQWLQNNDKGQAVAVGAINALTNLVKRSDASTIMELEIVLKDAQEQLQKVVVLLFSSVYFELTLGDLCRLSLRVSAPS